ncbi:MAG: flavodoxin family protein [Chitinispirillaceae bacterium]
MQVGIVVHSQTGHTVLLARAVADKLRKAGDEVDLHILRPRGKINPGSSRVELGKVPDPLQYDLLMIAGPVWAFNCSPAVSAYMETIEDNSLQNKPCLSFVTMGLPVHALNANRALAVMDRKLARKGAQVLQGYALHWFINANKNALEMAAETIASRVKGVRPAPEPPSVPPKPLEETQSE